MFLSARPHVYKDKAESRSYLHFEELRVQKGIGLHCVPTLLAGSLDSGWKLLVHGDFRALADTKCLNFLQFAQLYPEFSFVFVGDNGQGDVMAAAKIKALLGDRLEAVFIHRIQPVELTPGFSALKDDAELRKIWSSFHFFETYVSAALFAASHGIISTSALIRIGSHAVTRLIELKDLIKSENWESLRLDLNRDLEQANEYLSHQSINQSISHSNNKSILPLIPSVPVYSIGSRVLTPFGIGKIRSFDPIWSMYRIELFDWRLSNNQPVWFSQHTSDIELFEINRVGARVFVGSLGMTGVIENIRTHDSIYQIRLTQWKLRSDKESIKQSNNQLNNSTNRSSIQPNGHLFNQSNHARCYVHASDCTEIIACVGELVHCAPFGYGVVTRYRPQDGMYEIHIRLNTQNQPINQSNNHLTAQSTSQSSSQPRTLARKLSGALSLSSLSLSSTPSTHSHNQSLDLSNIQSSSQTTHDTSNQPIIQTNNQITQPATPSRLNQTINQAIQQTIKSSKRGKSDRSLNQSINPSSQSTVGDAMFYTTHCLRRVTEEEQTQRSCSVM